MTKEQFTLIDASGLGDLVDFSPHGSYSTYNWELFFHSVLLIAENLSRNQRFEEAHRWFHYIFDPTSDSDGRDPGRYWRFLPFFKAATPASINELLALLQATNLSPEDQRRRDELRASIADWKRNPFDPHRIARLRPSAYQWTVVMKYLDNLIAWGDQLFRRDTIESINEATQLYLLAADILGPRPRRVTMGSRTRPLSYATIASSLDDFSYVLVQAEALVRGPGDSGVTGASPTPSMMTVFAPFFCIPRNDKLEGYWDLVENRLFKIRHCMNIEGVVRQLPLYEPPIDPGLLVRARAAGVDLGAVLSDTALPVPAYRFDVLSRRATELCAEVRSLGSALLSAIEKQDAEHLTLMRAEHEAALLALVEDVRQAQLDEARSGRESLLASRQTAVNRFVHYERMLGVETPRAPQEGENIQPLPAPQKASVLEQDGTKLIDSEREEFARLSAANDLQVAAGTADVLASYFRLIPDFTIGFAGSGTTFGGSFLGSAASMYAGLFRAGATQASYEAGRAGRLAGLTLRENDWVLQRNQAALEIMQIDRQLIATDIRIDIAEKELRNHRKQIANSQVVEDYLRDKFSNKALYGWMAGQVSSIHFQAYQLAYDIARRAEKAYRHELGLNDGETHFIQFGYWDSLRKGLLAGDRLAHDIRKMETSYLERNRREFEITKHVSLRRLAPDQLVLLRNTAECTFDIPEWLFDLDGPGHYMRRLKNVSLSVPCVVGPYTGVHCKFTLLKSEVRIKPIASNKDDYPRKPRDAGDDARFVDYAGAIEAMVTSGGSNDSGLFETNLRDERYLPFEGSGAISTWRIELPDPSLAQFDYKTISDVILHLRYTAREGGETFKTPARESAKDQLKRGFLLISVKDEFPTEWARAAADPDTVPLDLTLTTNMLPYVLSKDLQRKSVHLFDATKVPNTGMPVGLKILEHENEHKPLESPIMLGALTALKEKSGGAEPILIVELGSPEH